MLQEMPVREYLDWQALYGIEPWGYEVDNVQAGYTRATIVQAMCGGSHAPRDFMLGDQTPTPEQVGAHVSASMLALGGVSGR